MDVLDLIKEDESLDFISLKEAINLLATRTKSTTFGIATYLLNKSVHSALHGYHRSIDYKIHISSYPDDRSGWVGENYAFTWLSYIAENEKHLKKFRVSNTDKYNNGCEESFWKRADFLNLECVKVLSSFETKEWNILFNKQQYIWDGNYLEAQLADQSPLWDINEDLYFEHSFSIDDIDYPAGRWIDKPTSQTKELPLFFKNKTFSMHEATCLMARYDPLETQWDYENINWLAENPKYEQASNFIFSAVRTSLFEEFSNGEYFITSINLKALLTESNLTIDGFNDCPVADTESTDLIENTQLKNTIASLELDVAIEQATVKKLNEEIEKLKAELLDKDQKIKELEQLNQNADSDLPDISVEQLTGLAKRNQLAQDRQGMARIIALSFWEKDQNILIGDMADRVYRTMIDYCEDDLPQLTDTLKSWIRPVATEEAQKKGRPKSSG